ncbi:MAG TPA: caspase family protein [Blastocatellia bacterium]|nr:caspase family protein [Blastocatellia bacterium]
MSQTGAAAGQDQRERGLKIQIGATRDEASRNAQINLWAVVIGISRYANGDKNLDGYQITNLKNAADDAQAIYEFLQSPAGGGFRDVSEGGNMVLLKDEQATKANVEAALNRLKQTKPEDYFVIYIAAHGAIMPYRKPGTDVTVDVPYFVLYDTDLRKPRETAMEMEAFSRLVSEIPAKKGLVLSDTCHSGGVQLAGRDTSSTSIRANNEYIKEMSAITNGVGFISAADQLEQSFERDDLNQGVFTYCLLEGLGGIADKDNDGKVTFNELTAYLRDEVPRLTDNKQHPKANTTAIEANYLPLSVVRYTDASVSGSKDYGLLVVRTPDINGVQVSVDGAPVATMNTRTQYPLKVPAGARTLSFAKDGLKREIQLNVEAGRSRLVEVNLTFSESDEDSLVAASDLQYNVFLREDKEPSKEAKDLFYKGVESFNKQRFEEAIGLFDQAVKANGGAYADALVYRGRAEQSAGRKEAAITSFKAALALRPTDFETETLLAEAKFNAGYDVEEVAATLRGIIRRHRNFDFARVVYGDVLLLRKDFIGAERELRRAITINPKSPPARLILADVLTYQDSRAKMEEAVQQAEEGLRLFQEVSRKQVSASKGLRRLSLSHVLFGGGRYTNDAAMAEAWHMVGKTLTRRVYYDESLASSGALLDRARQSLEEARKLASKLSDKRRLALVLETSALNYFLKGDLARAIEDGEKSLSTAAALPDLKDFPDAHFTLFQAYEADQQFGKAATHLQKFIEVAGNQLSASQRADLQANLDRIKRLRDANRKK